MNDSPYQYRLIIEDMSEGRGEGIEVFVPALRAHILGGTVGEALRAYETYFADELARRKKEGMTMPAPDIQKKQKQIPLRIDEDLYEHIVTRARQKKISFNRFVEEALEQMVS